MIYVRRWNIKRLSLIAFTCLVCYAIISSGFYTFKLDAVIKDSRPEEVFEYVADFSKMMKLNPTVLNFKILSEAGNTHDWRYTVLYTERLSHWPYWLNTAKGDYVVTKSMSGVVPTLYTIQSKHETCFLHDVICLHAESEYKFSALGKDTYCIETIRYHCLPFLSWACRRELEYQRKAVMYNLTIIFNKKQL